jgi:hydrogenase expression/formation protein HypC
MCLAVPGKIIERHEEHGLAMGKVDFSGTVVPICLAYVPEAQVGEYVIVHAGFALNVIDEEEARKTFELLDELDLAQDDLSPKATE